VQNPDGSIFSRQVIDTNGWITAGPVVFRSSLKKVDFLVPPVDASTTKAAAIESGTLQAVATYTTGRPSI